MKTSFASLPLPPPAQRLTRNLTPDPAHTSAQEFQSNTLKKTPVIQRRARILDPSAHFSYVSPLPIPFPYRIPAPEDSTPEERINVVDTWLAKYEPQKEITPPGLDGLGLYSSDLRDQKRELLALSHKCLEDCLPHLDVGDALETIGSGSLIPPIALGDDQPPSLPSSSAGLELVSVLSGQSVLMSDMHPASEPDPDAGYAPWSLRYCGHQFGTWAGQLGDGRAISILETPHPDDPNQTYEIQLKGAGRTPFSRSADGLAVLRSSIREFLGAEAMRALRIPTTRSLAIISLPDLPVVRERVESACIVSRVAPSFLRIGSFEALNPPSGSTMLYLLNPSATQKNEKDLEGLRVLGEWVVRQVLKLDVKDGESWGRKLVVEVARRNALMVAGWQAYGFMHGVINTDNVSVAGLTIDYGPYAFMDVYDYGHICNHTDEEGRYSFKLQPTMIIYAIRALLRSLAPLIGAEDELGHAVLPQWAANAASEQIEEWSEGAQKKHGEEIENILKETFMQEYWGLMRKRLGLDTSLPGDNALIQSLLDILQEHQVDYHSTFRTLCSFRPSFSSEATTQLIERLNIFVTIERQVAASQEWSAWLEKYANRINQEEGANDSQGSWLQEREEGMKSVNPRFILRQWLLEEVIQNCEKEGLARGRAMLNKVLEMATFPYRPWGAEGDERPEENLSPEEREERRFCSLGKREMLGFQCSCSS